MPDETYTDYHDTATWIRRGFAGAFTFGVSVGVLFLGMLSFFL